LGGRFHQKGGGGGFDGIPGGGFGVLGGNGGGLGGIRYTVCAAANSVPCKPRTSAILRDAPLQFSPCGRIAVFAV
jgi:hypothetical protein